MKKNMRLSFRLSEEDYLMFKKVCKALQADEPYNESEFFRIMIAREFVALKKQGLITESLYP